jgi:hypothetical protein
LDSFLRKKVRLIGLVGIGTIASLTLYTVALRLGWASSGPELPQVLCVGECPIVPKLHRQIAGDLALNSDRPLTNLLPHPIDRQATSILIEKSRYRLTLYYNGQPAKSYPVVFGDNPQGDKLQEGDRRTPEGVFKLRDLYPHPQWSRFLWLDYPNAASWQKHNQAKAEGHIAPHRGIGGEVGIHGVPAGADRLVDARENWTWGCPALKNQDVNELYDVVQVGTVVEIVP